MKKIIYSLIKFPLKIIFIKTPFIKILKKRFKHHRFEKKKNIFWNLLDTLFQREYFNKLSDKEEIRNLVDSTLEDGEGRKWAESYYISHFQNLEELKKRQIGNISTNKAFPIFESIIKHIHLKNLSNDKYTYIIQLGSSSGRDLEFFLKIFPNLTYISTDINSEILQFQKQKYSYKNFKYFKCHAEEINKCIDYFKIFDQNLLLFSNGSLQYVNPFFLEIFFKKLKKYEKINLFLNEPVSLSFMNKDELKSEIRGKISYSHRYDKYANNLGFNINEKKLIKPYSKDDIKHWNTGHFYLQISR